MMKSALAMLALALWGCGPEAESICSREGEEIFPDEELNGQRVGDWLESYFGEYEGTLSWAAGGETKLTLTVPYEPGTPYTLANVWRCEARHIHYDTHAHVASLDGAFDTDVNFALHRRMSLASGADLVTSFSGITDWQWQPALEAKLGVDLERYSSSYVHFELDWPATSAAPTGGILRLRGTLALDPKIQDTIQVATLAF
jgi:hypothetical protein